MSTGVVDPGRLRRALTLHVDELEPDALYRVTGGRRPHLVRHTPRGWTCDCPDQLYAGERACKHRLGVYLHRRLTPAVRAVLLGALDASDAPQRTTGPLSPGPKSVPDRQLPGAAAGAVEPTVERDRG